MAKRHTNIDSTAARSPKVGEYVVLRSWELSKVDLDSPQHFLNARAAELYANEEAIKYPGLQFVVCPIEMVISVMRVITKITE